MKEKLVIEKCVEPPRYILLWSIGVNDMFFCKWDKGSWFLSVFLRVNHEKLGDICKHSSDHKEKILIYPEYIDPFGKIKKYS